MGRLSAKATDDERLLEGETLVGRSSSCTIRLEDPRVSTVHAAIRWLNGRWHVRDLNSTNGTWRNGERLEPHAEVPLTSGDRLVFADDRETWLVTGVEAPEPVAVPANGGEARRLVNGIITVPSDDEPLATILRAAEGGWRLELGDQAQAVDSGAQFTVADSLWRFSCPTEWHATERTGPVRLIAGALFRFFVSSDEERVEIDVVVDRSELTLGHQSGFYLLLTLARVRHEDCLAGTDSRDAGWRHRDELMNMLKCSETQLNVWIHRVRSKLEAVGFLDYASVIERRDGTGLIRIGGSRYQFHSR